MENASEIEKWKLTNLFRQLDKLATSAKNESSREVLVHGEFHASEEGAASMMKAEVNEEDFNSRKEVILQHITRNGTTVDQMDDVLYSDLHLVLPNDMLTKVDLMSMANSLEVRVPFLDHRVAEFAFGLPFDQKIGNGIRKRIVQETFRKLLQQRSSSS